MLANMATLTLMSSLSAATATYSKIEVKVPGWPTLPFPFSEGVLHCTKCAQGLSEQEVHPINTAARHTRD